MAKVIKRRDRVKKLYYFNGHLYRVIKHNRGEGVVYATDVYNSEEQVLLSYVEFKNKAYNAYTLAGAAKLLNRAKRTIEMLVKAGYVSSVDRVPMGPGRHYYALSREAVLDVHKVLSMRTGHRPRKDGSVLVKGLPSREELMTEMKNEITLYARNKDGDFVRIWEAEEW